MIDAIKLIEFLGVSTSDSDYQNYLVQNRIYELPYLTVDEDEEFQNYLSAIAEESDIDEDDLQYEREQAEERVEESQLYQEDRDSIALVYELRENYEALYPQMSPLYGDFVLKEFAIYAKDNYFTGYKGSIPFGLRLNFSQKEVWKLLGQPIASRYIKELMTDLYYIEELIVNISYEQEKISIIHFRRLNCYDQQMIGMPLTDFPSENDSRFFDTSRWIHYFGYYFFSKELKQVFPAYTEDDFSDEECDDFCKKVDLKREYGITLFYNCRDDLIKFSGFLIDSSNGYNNEFQGKKPFNLKFGMSLDEVVLTIGHEPNVKNISEKTIFANYIWFFENMIIKANFDLIDYQLKSIAVFDPVLKGNFY